MIGKEQTELFSLNLCTQHGVWIVAHVWKAPLSILDFWGRAKKDLHNLNENNWWLKEFNSFSVKVNRRIFFIFVEKNTWYFIFSRLWCLQKLMTRDDFELKTEKLWQIAFHIHRCAKCCLIQITWKKRRNLFLLRNRYLLNISISKVKHCIWLWNLFEEIEGQVPVSICDFRWCPGPHISIVPSDFASSRH